MANFNKQQDDGGAGCVLIQNLINAGNDPST